MLRGMPISLLKFLIVPDADNKVFFKIFVVVVFPLLPVIAIIFPPNLLNIFFEMSLKAKIVLGT